MLGFINSTIDAVQGAKTQFINQFVQDAKYSKPLQAFVDAQTTFTKQAAKSANEVFTTLTTEAAKFDVAKAFSKSVK